ncbi:unnamed protein product [Scytosiphon promiscuus]
MFLLPAAAARVILYCSALVLPPSPYRAARAFTFRPPVSTTIDRHGRYAQTKHDPRTWLQCPGEGGYLRDKKSTQRLQELRANQDSAPSDTDSASPTSPVATGVASVASTQQERPGKRAGRSPLGPSAGSTPPSSLGSESPVQTPSPPLAVLHLNEDFAAICKPPLMHVHRPEFGTKDKEFVMQKARNQLGRRIFLPHRLDRGTSGCLLLGFSSEAVKVLHQAVADPRSSKTYVAIVRGSGQAFIDRGWFTVDRPIKDDKKILREASTRFLFVKGGDDPDPRCCLVLAQPSSGRFHQIRRHLNGLSHPIVGDSVHGNSRFNREVAAHPNPAPSGRLMLHCLRLSLPALPDVGSDAWRGAVGGELLSSVAEAAAQGARPESGEVSEKVLLIPESDNEGNYESGRSGGSGEPGLPQGEEEDGQLDAGGAASPGPVPTKSHTPFEPEEAASEANKPIPERSSGPDSARRFGTVPVFSVGTEASDVSALPSTMGDATAAGSSGPADDGAGSEDNLLAGKGFRAYSEPPDDMMEFLRGMSWWEEGLIQAAEQSGR